MANRSNARKERTPRSTRNTELTDSPRSTVTPTAEQGSEDSTTKRVSFAMKADGTFDVESMRSSNKDALRAALSDPSLAASLGITSTQDANDARLLTTITGGLFDGLSFINIALAKRAGYSDAQAAIAAFTSDEKEMLAEPTAKVINKWFPDIGGKYRDEIMLCLALTNVIAAKVLLLRSGAELVQHADGSTSIAMRSTVTPTPPEHSARVIPITPPQHGESQPS